MTPSAPKILFVITKSNWGGAQAYVHTLATAYAGRGLSVGVALGGTGAAGANTGRLAETLRAAGVPIHVLPSFTRDVSLTRELRALSELFQLFRKERPTVVHLNSSKAGGLGALAARLARVPRIVFTSHGLAYDENRPLAARVLIWFSTWITFLLVHRVIVISSDNFERARRLPFCRSKIRLVYNGIAPLDFKAPSEARALLLPAALNEDLWIGTIAELTNNKNLASLVDAAALLKKRGQRFALCIIGQGEEAEALTAQIASHDLTDSVHLLGFVPEASTLLRAFDLFTLVSTKEGLPYVLLEAGEASCAVVATAIPGTTDIIDASTGILVTPKHVDEIADALERLLTDHHLRETLGQALHEKVRHQFSLDRMLDGVHTTYTD